MTDEDVLGVILKAARTSLARERSLSPTSRLAAMTISTLTTAKLLLRVQRTNGDDFRPAVWEQLEQRSDDLASRHFEVITAGYEGVPGIQLKSEREYLHLVRNRRGVRWCRTTIEDGEPCPFTEDMITREVPLLADTITGRIVGDLAQLRAALSARGSTEQQTSYLIGETVALVASAKLHLAMWGNGKLSAAFEEMADRVAAQHQQSILAYSNDLCHARATVLQEGRVVHRFPVWWQRMLSTHSAPPVVVDVEGVPQPRHVLRWALLANGTVLVPTHVGKICHLVDSTTILDAVVTEPGLWEKVVHLAGGAAPWPGGFKRFCRS